MLNAISTVSGAVSTQGALVPPLASEASHVGKSFADMLAEVGRTAVADLERAESVSMKSLQGNFDPRAAADAVMSAERTLQTAVVVRDKIVAAYLEISRMAI